MKINVDGLARKIALYGTAFLVIVGVGAMLNKWFVADPILRAVNEERVSRQFADSLLFTRMGSLNTTVAAGTYTRREIDDLVRDAEKTHERLEQSVESIEHRVGNLERRMLRPR